MHPKLASIFTFQSRVAFIAWIMLICAPFWDSGKALVLAAVFILCGAYVYLLLCGKQYDEGSSPPGPKSFFSMSGVVKLFTYPRAVLIGWVHFLAFDLMVGLIILVDSQQIGISHWLMLPVLFFVLMIGPSGLFLYLLLRVFYAENYFAFLGGG